MKPIRGLLRFLFTLLGACLGSTLILIGVMKLSRAVAVYSPIDCSSYVNDPALTIPLDSRPGSIRSWANEVFTTTERWNYQEWNTNRFVVSWLGNATHYRAFFNNPTATLNYIEHDYWVGEGINGHQLINCFGEPGYYQAYWEPNPHGESLIIEVIYPGEGLIFSSYQIDPISPVLRSPYEWSDFGEVRHFSPVENREQIAPYLSQAWSMDPWDQYGWADIALLSWAGWGSIQVVTDEIIAQGSPRAPATATAIAASFLTAPPFPTQADLSSPVCQSVISPILYNLQYGTATLEETRLLLRGVYQHFYGASDHRIESSSRSDDTRTWEVLTWNVHTDESSEHDHFYTANFDNDILQNAESTVYGTELSEYIACFGEPSAAILSIDDTANGRLQSLYLFFPTQGIVTATYLFDDEITEPNEDFPVMMAYQSNPQIDSTRLLNAAFGPWDTATYEEWIGNLQPWQGFDKLLITEP